MESAVKSSLRDQVQMLKNEGKSGEEMAAILGVSTSYIKKLSASLSKKPSALYHGLKRLKENPYIPLDSLMLDSTQKKNLYKTELWRNEIFPQRILHSMKTDLKWRCQELEKVNRETRQILDSRPEFVLWLEVRKEFDAYIRGLEEIKQRHCYIHTPDGSYDLVDALEHLAEYRKSIPEEQRFGSSKKRPLPLGHDLEYVKTVHNISVIEARIYTWKMKQVQQYTEEFLLTAREETKGLISRMYGIRDMGIGAPLSQDEVENRQRWVDINKYLERDFDDYSPIGEQERINLTAPKRFSKAGSSRRKKQRNNAIAAMK